MCAVTRALAAALLLRLALCLDVPAPANLVLSSQYFVHWLSWEKGPGSPDGVQYTVTVRALSNWREEEVVKGCENVTSPLRCDLTEALSDAEETYYLSVFAALDGHISPPSHCEPFQPILQTSFEAPLLSVSACNRSLCVDLRAPAERLHSVYDSHRFSYRLTVSSEDRAEFGVTTEGLRSVILKDLSPGQRYCVNVSIVGHNTPHRPPVCADVPKPANLSDVVISVVLILLVLLVLMCSSRLVSHRLFLKPPLPAVLSSIESGNKALLLFTHADLISTLFEDRNPVQKTRRDSEDTDGEGETEAGVSYERVVAQYLDAQGSSLLIFPVSSGSGSSPDGHASLSSSTAAQSRNLIVFEDGHVQTAEPTSSEPDLLPEDTHSDDGESDADVNLFSVTLGALQAGPEETSGLTEELGSEPQSRLLTDSQPHNYIKKQISEEEEEEEEDEECSGYLSRN